MSHYDHPTSDTQEQKYQSHISAEKIKVSRLMCLMGIVLYTLFAVVDYWALNNSFEQVLAIRTAIVVNLAIVFGLTYHRVFLQFYEVILLITYVSSAMGIVWMIKIAGSEEYASEVYFAGLILVIMTLFSWSHLKTTSSFFTTFIIIASFVYFGVLKEGKLSFIDSPYLITTPMFLVAATVIGFINQVIRDRYLKDNFLLQQSLKEAIEQKTIEAKDNAYLANHDPLTDLPNRRYVTELLEESLETAKREDKILAILFLDLNGFKQVNDVYGHNVGDEVLKIVAKRLEFAIREGDSISRLAGDEFLVGLLMEKEGLSEVSKMSAKFTAIISKSMNIDGMRIKIGVSIGIAAYPMHGDKINVLINIADKKMYKTKKGVQSVVHDRQLGESEPVVIFPGNSRRR